eukprot:SAG31_NODE_13946_length_835_cov_11.224185_2_plen_56_part_00
MERNACANIVIRGICRDMPWEALQVGAVAVVGELAAQTERTQAEQYYLEQFQVVV